MNKIISVVAGGALLLTSLAANARTIEMRVNGLVCAFCAQGIEKSLRKDPATADVFVSLKQSLVVVALKDDADIADEKLRSLLKEAGYTVVGVKRSDTPLADFRKAGKP